MAGNLDAMILEESFKALYELSSDEFPQVHNVLRQIARMTDRLRLSDIVQVAVPHKPVNTKPLGP